MKTVVLDVLLVSVVHKRTGSWGSLRAMVMSSHFDAPNYALLSLLMLAVSLTVQTSDIVVLWMRSWTTEPTKELMQADV